MALAVALLVAACQAQPPIRNEAIQLQPVTRDEAIRIANEYLVQRMGGDLGGLVPRAEERPDSWIVGYDFDPPSPGGTPTLSVDKGTREVRVISLTQ